MAKNDPLSEAAKPAVEAASKVAEDATAAVANAANSYGGVFASSFKASQDYQAKLIHFFQTNLEANVAFAQKLAGTKTPADFVQLATSHARERAEALSDQARQLAELGQEASRKALEVFTPPKH